MENAACFRCNGTALIRKDGKPLGPEWRTMDDFIRECGPCPFCAAGELEANFRKLWAA